LKLLGQRPFEQAVKFTATNEYFYRQLVCKATKLGKKMIERAYAGRSGIARSGASYRRSR
jgi:hypothetical protein